MKNLYHIDELMPLYAEMIQREKLDAATLTKRLADNIQSIEYDGMAVISTAVRLRWLEGITAWIEREAENSNGMIDRDKLTGHVESRMIQIARGGVWSSNPFRSIVEREELEQLAKAKEPFGDSLLSPFEVIDNERRKAEWQAKREAAVWYVKKGNTYLGWENKSVRSIERAKPFRYEDRPALPPGWSYEMVEAA